MAQVSAYSAQNVTVTYLGKVIGGFTDGDDAIMVERNAPTMTQTVGIQGDGLYTQSSDKSGVVTLKLLQDCEDNAFLSAKIQAAEIGGITSGDLIITEIGADGGAIARKAVIEGIPKYQRGAAAVAVEWRFLSTDIGITQSVGAEV